MMIFATYFLIVFVLLILNSIPVFGGKRTRRFAQKPGLFFTILIIGFLVGRVVGFLYYEMNGRQQRSHDTSYDVKNIRGKIYTKGEAKREFASENEIVSGQTAFYENVSYLLKMATVQALIVALLCYWGMKKYEEKRYKYYRRNLILYSVFFGFCFLLNLFVF
jgi:hypothetical protein